MPTNEVKVPDIGDFKEVEVIEVLVKPGDTIAKEQSIVTLESDKATMEIPSPGAGVVKELRIKANSVFTVVGTQLKFQSYYKMPAAQTSQENCVAHNGSLIPIPGRDVSMRVA